MKQIIAGVLALCVLPAAAADLDRKTALELRATAILGKVWPPDRIVPDTGPESMVSMGEMFEVLVDHGMTEAEACQVLDYPERFC